MTNDENESSGPKIMIRKNGPYRVFGRVPLVAKTQIVSAQGEPLAWKKDGVIDTASHMVGWYTLCRCGKSSDKPFCDHTHQTLAWDGTEIADAQPTAVRRAAYPGDDAVVVVRHDDSLCADSGFCSTRLAHISKLVKSAGQAGMAAQIIAMVEHCPSGSLTYAPKAGMAEVEPDLPQQIAVTAEITSDGPIAGPLWVTGGVPVVRSDGQLLESRNRVTLCNCGRSKNKPFCDGTHRDPDPASVITADTQKG
jgi:CDGSH-type Zn-finger protein